MIRTLETLPASDLHDSNRAVMKWVSDGYPLRREDRADKDLHLGLIDVDDIDANVFRAVSQLEIVVTETRIPDVVLYVDGLPLVVIELKSAIRPEATLHDAYVQFAVRYRRDVPELLKYNVPYVIGDGVNSRMGAVFSAYEFFYAWRKVTGDESVAPDGIDSLHTMTRGLFDRRRLLSVVRDFVFFPDASRKEVEIVPRYPQFYAATKPYENVLTHRRPEGDGKGGTCFGATGCGKSYTMLFLSRLLMRSVELASPTLVLTTDRTDLDDQLSATFVSVKSSIGDGGIVSVDSRAELRRHLEGKRSGGVFLIADALHSDGVEKILRLGDDAAGELDLFDPDYLDKIDRIELPDTRIKLLQQLLAKAISDLRKLNRAKGVDFSRKFRALVDKYNERDEDSVLVSNVLEDFGDAMVDMIMEMRAERGAHEELGIDAEEKAFHDILLSLARKYDFHYPKDKLVALAKAVKALVDDVARYTHWSRREDIKAELRVHLILLLAKHGYPPVDRDEVYREIFEQAENFKRHRER